MRLPVARVISSSRCQRILAALVVAAAIVALFQVRSVTDPQVAAATDCADVMFIGARGSGEPMQVRKNGKLVTYHHGVGAAVDFMAGQLGDAVSAYGEEMRILPVIYDADSTDDLIPSKHELEIMAASGLGGAATLYYTRHLKPYIASLNQGVSQTIVAIRAVLSLCPETEIVLAGLSQGAMAVHQAELRLEREGDEESLDAIGGTLLLGDGDRAPNTHAKLIGGAPRSGEGVRVYLHGVKPKDVAEPETTVEICVSGDLVCDFKLHIEPGASAWYRRAAHVHSNYTNPPQRVYLVKAVEWLAREMGLVE